MHAQGTLVFNLAGLETLRQALQLYRTILGTKKRRWAGEGKRYAMAFSAFGHGVYNEFSRRAATEGEERALAALEQEPAQHRCQAGQPTAGAVQLVLQSVQGRAEAAFMILMPGECSVWNEGTKTCSSWIITLQIFKK